MSNGRATITTTSKSTCHPELPLISSRLVFKGNIGEGKGEFGSGGFLTNPTSCTGPGPQTTSKLTLKSEEGATATATYTTPIGTENCGILPFAPTFSLTPGSGETGSDAPDGVTAEATLPHNHSPEGLDSSQLKTASITLPEGMTMNPSAAHEVTEACTPKQIGIGKTEPVTCPEVVQDRYGHPERSRTSSGIAAGQHLSRRT